MSFPERYLLQSPLRVGDGAGGYQIEWQDMAYLWGQLSKTRVSGSELSGESRHYSTNSLMLNDATGSGLCVGCRLKSGDKFYEVIGIEHEGNEYSQILVRSDSPHVL